MAYAVVISLQHTIERLLNSSHLSLAPHSREILEFADKEVEFLRKTLERLDKSSKSSSRRRMNDLDEQIREAVCKLDDLLESHVSDEMLLQSDQGSINGDEIEFSIDLQDLKQDIHSFIQIVIRLEDEYIEALHNMLPEEEDDVLSSTIDFGGEKSKMVGLSEFRDLKKFFTIFSGPAQGLIVLTLIGMAGIGKTTLAKVIFEDPDVVECFNCRVWMKVGRKYLLKEILLAILAQANPATDKMIMEEDEKLAQYLKESLKGRRFLIVLDDVWDKCVWLYLESCFPKEENGSRVLLTTRLAEVARVTMGFVKEMRLLNKEESWDLLREKVFVEELCPPQLEKAGKKIAELCDGLPQTIVTVANLLFKAEKTPEYWSEVAEKQNSVFVDAYDEISKVLYPSYEHLPERLKMFFLYMGVFPQNYEIPQSKLSNMWTAEGFFKPNIGQISELHAMKYLADLLSNSLVIVYQEPTIAWMTVKVKTCGLHSSFWHLCNREARKKKFFHVLNSHKDGLGEGIKGKHRLCIHNNVLLGIKYVYNSMEKDCASTARSLLCYGPYHQYPVPVCFGLKLLRVLDALTIRFYEFPVEVVKLVQLRYIALTYNGKLPASISKLRNLQFLIVRQHLNIKSCRAPSYLPIEIWFMKELQHLQIMGSDLPAPRGPSLPNLFKLSDVSTRSCTKDIFERIPNLQKLGIRIEMAPDAAEPLSCFDHISHLKRLSSLKCVVMNSAHKSEVVAPTPSLSNFPSGLRKLTLSGLGYPWEEMSKIASLPKLTVLKLRHYAFRGSEWEIKRKGFQELKILLIEDSDLVQWKMGCRSFPRLKYLSIKHCYKLDEIHWKSDSVLEKIEVVDCNPLVVTCLKQLEEARLLKAKKFTINEVYC